MEKIDKHTARTLIKGLQRGTIRPGGAKFLHCGHENWVNAQLEELEELAEDGGAAVHFVRGSYGAGKTHFLNYLEELALEKYWATVHLECRKDKVEIDRFENMYPVITQKLRLNKDSVKNEEEIILSEEPIRKLLNLWSEMLFNDVGYDRSKTVRKTFEAECRIFDLLQEQVMRRNLPGDFQRALCAYPRAKLQDDITSQDDIIAWLRGENRKISIPFCLLTRPGQRPDAPGVDRRLVNPVIIRPITTATSLDVFRGLIWLLKRCKFKGIVLSIDEVEHIARLRPPVRQERSLQTLREFVDNTDGEAGLQYAAIYFAATPNMFDDERYFRSYDALATRIEPVSSEINWRAPVIDLEKTPLSKSQLTEVAKKICSIHRCAYAGEIVPELTNLNEIVEVVDQSRYRIAKPRLLCRAVVDQLERLRQGLQQVDTLKLVTHTANVLSKEEENGTDSE